MKADVCTRFPQKDGRDSQLYMDLFKHTGRNRSLTNYIYALTQQDYIKSAFAPSDFNDQKELKASEVIKKLKVDNLINTSTAITNAEKELGAVNSSGSPVIYKTVEEIIDKVIDFNSREDNPVVAKINKESNGYSIIVQGKNDTNFMTNASYIAGIKQLDYAYSLLESLGLSVAYLSDDAKRALNALNASNFYNLVGLFKGIASGRVDSVGDNIIQLLIDLLLPFEESGLSRLQKIFGDKLVPALKHLISASATIPPELASYTEELMLSSTFNAFNRFRKFLGATFDDVDTVRLKNNLNDLYRNDTVTEQDKALKDCLYELYEKYGLDKDTINTMYGELESLQDVVSRIILSINNNKKVLRARGQLSPERAEDIEARIQELENQLRKKEYAASILSFLKNAVTALDRVNIIDTSLTTFDSLNEVASQIFEVKENIGIYKNVITKLLDIKSLVKEGELTESDANTIQEWAKTLNSLVTTVSDKLYKKEYDLVYALLKPYWGEDDVKKAGGSSSFEVALSDLLKCSTININYFDRMLASMTEVSDPVLATLGAVIKDMHSIRDEKLKDIQLDIRRITDDLYKSGSDSSFMFETLEDGTVKIVSTVDWNAYNRAYKAQKEHYEAAGIPKSKIKTLMDKWEQENMDYEEFDFLRVGSITEAEGKPKVYVPNSKYRKALPKMTDAQRTYYNLMMGIKASLEANLESHGVQTSLFTPVQITTEISDAITTSGPLEAMKLVKDNFVDNFKRREDDTVFGNKEVLESSSGTRIQSLPVFYLTKLSDQKRLSKDFSKSLMAYAAMEVNHETLAERIDILELARDFLLERPVTQTVGEKALVQSAELMGKRYVSPVTRKTKETKAGKWIDDIYEAKVYGKRQKEEGEILGIDIAKFTNSVVGYTSITGLAVNVPGSIANMLVGKIQMLIESAGGEFYGFKDYDKAIRDYWKMMPEVLGEVASNNVNSELGLLMEKFDVLDDYYDRLRDSGFHKTAVGKIIGNTSIMFLYGLGEHMLHAQTMLAVLNHTKVIDDKGNKRNLLDAFEVETISNNGKLKIKEGWKTIEGYEINEKFLERQKNIIAYANRSLNGAFGPDEKGAAHRYAIGRLIMNFRQWMPAHYARRFNKLHYDATLGDFREGYYVTVGRFVWTLLKDLKNKEFQIATRWDQLKKNPMEFANFKRARAETIILGILVLLSRLSFGDDPKDRSWAASILKYEIKRMLLETYASNPLNLNAFINNVYTIMNEPIAAISATQRLTSLFGIGDLITMKRIESGVNKGKLAYFRRVERSIPFYDQVDKWWNMDTDDRMFTVFNKAN